MAAVSKIEWCDATWNPVTGCRKISPGCTNCYAERFAERFRGVPGHPFAQGFTPQLWPERLDLPLHWRRPRRIFVNSMSDLFLEDVPDAFIDAVFETMDTAPWHTFQVLTKRPERLVAWAQARYGRRRPWPAHVWIGVSVERQDFLWRARLLRQVPAPIRFLSIEPLLGPVRLGAALRGIGWVIVGGESGPGARPMRPEWARALRDACLAAGVPFFFKQFGEFDARGRRVGKARAGRRLDGRAWGQVPPPWPDKSHEGGGGPYALGLARVGHGSRRAWYGAPA